MDGTQPNLLETEKTQPPLSALRVSEPTALYDLFPQLGQLTTGRPEADETCLTFLHRLAISDIPEEAVTFTAFAVLPKMAIWWGYECLRVAGDELPQQDRAMMELVAQWTTFPNATNRFRTMQAALFAPVRSPAVSLALAVGWSGGPIAPNDPAQVPSHRAPRAVNAAVLSSLARAGLPRRPQRLALFVDQATQLFRV